MMFIANLTCNTKILNHSYLIGNLTQETLKINAKIAKNWGWAGALATLKENRKNSQFLKKNTF